MKKAQKFLHSNFTRNFTFFTTETELAAKAVKKLSEISRRRFSRSFAREFSTQKGEKNDDVKNYDTARPCTAIQTKTFARQDIRRTPRDFVQNGSENDSGGGDERRTTVHRRRDLRAEILPKVQGDFAQAKELVPHGEWGKWLEKNFSLSQPSASRFMRCAQRFANYSTLNNFNSSQLITMLELPEGETEQFIEAKAAEGKLVLLAEARLGELFSQLPKATKGTGGNRYATAESREIRAASKFSTDEPPTKLETARDMGFSKDQVSQFQRLADNPDAVQKAIVTAEERASTALAGRNCTSSYRVRGKIRR